MSCIVSTTRYRLILQVSTVQRLPPAPATKKNDLASQQPPKKNTKPTAQLTPKPPRKASSWSFGIVAEGGASHISKGSPFQLCSSKKNNEPEDLALSSPAPSNQNLFGGPAGFHTNSGEEVCTIEIRLVMVCGWLRSKTTEQAHQSLCGCAIQLLQYAKCRWEEYMRYAISVSNANYDQVVSDFYQGSRSAIQRGWRT